LHKYTCNGKSTENVCKSQFSSTPWQMYPLKERIVASLQPSTDILGNSIVCRSFSGRHNERRINIIDEFLESFSFYDWQRQHTFNKHTKQANISILLLIITRFDINTYMHHSPFFLFNTWVTIFWALCYRRAYWWMHWSEWFRRIINR